MPSASSNKYQYPQLIRFTKGSSNHRAAVLVAGQIVVFVDHVGFAPIIYLIGGFSKMAWYWSNFIVEDCLTLLYFYVCSMRTSLKDCCRFSYCRKRHNICIF